MSLSSQAWALLRCLACDDINTHGHVVDVTTKLNDENIHLTYTVYATNSNFTVYIKEEKSFDNPKRYFEISGRLEARAYNTIHNSDNKTVRKFPLSETTLAANYVKLLVENFLKEVTIETTLNE